MPTTWKQDERDFVEWGKAEGLEGKRQPSSGQESADGFIGAYSFEHKSRKRENFPAWLLKAFEQRRTNERLYPDKTAYVALSVHFGRGTPTRRFIATEVNFLNDVMTGELQELLDAKAAIEAAIGILTGGNPDESEE